MAYVVERKTEGRFPKKHERVSMKAEARSDPPRQMRVVWPADAPPCKRTGLLLPDAHPVDHLGYAVDVARQIHGLLTCCGRRNGSLQLGYTLLDGDIDPVEHNTTKPAR